MMSPTAPLRNRQLVWHTYSAQAYGIFHGDLDFCKSITPPLSNILEYCGTVLTRTDFGGWDGRSRVAKIDTSACPVYMLVGEYDWSNTPDHSAATAAKIPSAKCQTMKGLGHFPATENPKRFVQYLLEAVDFVATKKAG